MIPEEPNFASGRPLSKGAGSRAQDASRSERREASRQARALRVRTIRRRIFSGAVALFVAAWLLIAVVLVSGHDPALAAHKSANSTSGSPGSSTSPSAQASSSSGATNSGATSSVTTQQS